MRTKFHVVVFALCIAVAPLVLSSTVGAASSEKKCLAAIALQLKQAGSADVQQTIGTPRSAGAAATKAVDAAKIAKKCSAVPTSVGYTGCPAIISECADDSDTTLTGYSKCLDCLVKGLSGRVAQRTAPAKCGNGAVDGPDENCENASSCSAGQVCVDAGKADQCHCFTPPCGNGKVDSGEVCDPEANSSTCDATEVCNSSCQCGPPVCGDAKIEAQEACDVGATPSGCNSGEICSPTCTACVVDCQPSQTLTKFQFTTLAGHGCNGNCDANGVNAGNYCLSNTVCRDDLNPNGTCLGLPDPSFAAGQLRDDSNAVIGSLYEGCLYFGGGGNSATPPAPIPAGATVIMSAAGDSNQQNFTLTANDGNSIKDCSRGWDANGTKYCWNGADGPNLNGTCTSDADCGAARACNPAPRCIFGPPLAVNNPGSPPVSTCILNVFSGDMTGTLDASTGSPSLDLPLAAMVYVTGTNYGAGTPCPLCVGNVCNNGPKQGQACTPSSGDGSTSLDCPPAFLPPEHGPNPSASFGAPLPVTLSPTRVLASSISSPLTRPGKMCTQGYCDTASDPPSAIAATCSCDDSAENPPDACGSATCGLTGGCVAQPGAGAYGHTSATSQSDAGVAAGCLRSGEAKTGTISAVFCIPPTGAPSIDAAASLPGPGAVVLTVSMQLLP